MRSRLRRLWPTFVVPVVIAVTVGSDFVALPGFWREHAVTAGLVSGLALLLITVAVVESLLQQRDTRRWQTAARLGFKTFSGSIERALDDLSFALTGLRPPYLTYTPPWSEERSRKLTPRRMVTRVDRATLRDLFQDPHRWRAVEGAVVAVRIRHRETIEAWLPAFVAVGSLAEVAERLAQFNERLTDVQHPFVMTRSLSRDDEAGLDEIVASCEARLVRAVEEGIALQRELMRDAEASWWHPEERHLRMYGQLGLSGPFGA